MALTFQSQAMPCLDVRSYTLIEEMNRPFRARVVAVSLDPSLDLDALLGEWATLSLWSGGRVGTKAITGIVRRARQLASGAQGSGGGGDGRVPEDRCATLYEVEIAPPAALLRERSDNRIFQHRNLAQIVCEVAAGYGGLVPMPECVMIVQAQQPREYTTQYGETDLAFVNRLTEDSGVCYFFDHRFDSRWVLCDVNTRYLTPFEDPIPYYEASSVGERCPHVFAGTLKESLQPGKVTLRAHDPSKPDFPLFVSRAVRSEKQRRGEDALERYEYQAGAFSTATVAEGELRAGGRLAAYRARARTLDVSATFPLSPGATIPIVNHPGEGVDGHWLVIASRTSANERGLKHRLRLVPIGPLSPYRPKRRTPRPRIGGVQTATVWGAPGEKIPVDSLGRVRVRFHWDRTAREPSEPPTRYLRVSHPWAGQGFGAMFLPRAGQEVVVDFLDGDPDEPIVTGRVYNGVQVTPVVLPAHRTQSVIRTSTEAGGYNQILFDDAVGDEKLELRAERDSVWETGRNAKRSVGKDDSLQVGGSQRQVIAGSQSVTIGGNKSITAAKDITVDAGERLFLRGGINIDESAQWIDVRASVKYRVGAPRIELNGGDVIIKGGTVDIDGGDYLFLTAGAIIHQSRTLTINADSVRIKAGSIVLEGGTIELNP